MRIKVVSGMLRQAQEVTQQALFRFCQPDALALIRAGFLT